MDQFVRDVTRTVSSRAAGETRPGFQNWRDVWTRGTREQVLKRDTSALGSVPTALLVFLTHADAPAEAVRFAVQAGGGGSGS